MSDGRGTEKRCTYAALQGPTVDIVAVELADSHGGVLMRIHLDEREATVGLEAGFGDVTKVLEERYKVRLRGVRREVANVAGGLPLRGLLHNHIEALHAVGGEVVVSKGGSRCHAHGRHGLLLGDGGLPFLVGPVTADSSRAKPFAVHGAQCPFSISAVAKGDKAVATGSARLHVPHDACFRNNAEGGEGLEKDFIVDLIGQIADENVEVVGRIFLGSGV